MFECFRESQNSVNGRIRSRGWRAEGGQRGAGWEVGWRANTAGDDEAAHRVPWRRRQFVVRGKPSTSAAIAACTPRFRAKRARTFRHIAMHDETWHPAPVLQSVRSCPSTSDPPLAYLSPLTLGALLPRRLSRALALVLAAAPWPSPACCTRLAKIDDESRSSAAGVSSSASRPCSSTSTRSESRIVLMR